jgi:WD40-like Beta Propeller Repeat
MSRSNRERFVLSFLLLGASCARSATPDDSSADLPTRLDGGVDDAGDAANPETGAPESSPAVDASVPACDPTKPFNAPVPVSELNTVDDDTISDLSPDGLTAYVGTSHLVTGLHLFFATRASTTLPFGARQPLFPTGNFDDWSSTLTADGLTAIVSSDRSGNSSDLYVATRTSKLASFGPLAAAMGVNTTSNEEGPRWSADGKTLYFDSTRGGTRHIWSASVVAFSFGTPQKLTELASNALDAVPVLSPDELTIYFLSQRAPTTDGDIYVATRTSKTLPFANVQVLANVNSPSLDAPGYISPDGCTLYLSSLRGTGKFDIFVAQRPK